MFPQGSCSVSRAVVEQALKGCRPRPVDSLWLLLCVVLCGVDARAEVVRGGGVRRADCVVVFDATGANRPAPPREPRHIDCVDGDASCDADGERNGACIFTIALCLNSTVDPRCTPSEADCSMSSRMQ